MKKAPRPEGREFLSNVYLHFFQPLCSTALLQRPASQLDAWETFRARRQPHLFGITVLMIQGAAGNHKMLSNAVYPVVLRIRYVKIPHRRGPFVDVAHKKN